MSDPRPAWLDKLDASVTALRAEAVIVQKWADAARPDDGPPDWAQPLWARQQELEAIAATLRGRAGQLADVIETIPAADVARAVRPVAPEWQPIDSAPKEGAFLVFHKGAAGERVMVADGHMLTLSRATQTPQHLAGHHWTHWQPLPAPPLAAAVRHKEKA